MTHTYLPTATFDLSALPRCALGASEVSTQMCVLVICVLVSTVLYCFVYVYLFLFDLSVLV
jgi:hypothetical protein